MRILSYRNKLRLKRFAFLVLIIALVAGFCIAAYYFYLQRYVVYTSDGAYLDLPWQDAQQEAEAASSQFTGGELVMDSSVVRETVPEETEQVEAAPEIESPMRGYSVDPSTMESADEFLSTIDEELAEAQEAGEEADITVMITVKSGSGEYYYNSSLGSSAACASLTENLITELTSRDVRLIAMLPAFADSALALENQSEGLPISGGALWMDENGCYWIDPASDTAQDNLVSVCQELRRLGFTEVVFTDFAFPESEYIIYEAEYSRSELTAQVAQSVAEKLVSTGLKLSFYTANVESAFSAAEYGDRVYLSLDDGSQVSTVAALYDSVFSDPSIQLVFVTDSRDTRFDDYGVLRPVS